MSTGIIAGLVTAIIGFALGYWLRGDEVKLREQQLAACKVLIDQFSPAFLESLLEVNEQLEQMIKRDRSNTEKGGRPMK